MSIRTSPLGSLGSVELKSLFVGIKGEGHPLIFAVLKTHTGEAPVPHEFGMVFVFCCL